MNYAQLLAAVARWLDRDDLSADIPTFVQLGHASLVRMLAGAPTLNDPAAGNWLLTSSPDTYLYAALVESAPFLKDDARIEMWRAELDRRVAEVRRIRTQATINITDYNGLVEGVAAYLDRRDLIGSLPTFITQAHSSLTRLLAGVTPFAAPTTGNSNWLLTAHPDVYLYATLVEAAPYIGEDARLPLWRSELAERVEGVRRSRDETAITLTNLSGLVNAVTKYLDRRDLVGAVPLFVSLAETTLARRFADWGDALAPLAGGGANWLFTKAPDIYLYAALTESAPFVGDDPRLATWQTLLEQRISDVLTFMDTDEFTVPLRKAFTPIG
jgi:hypothetical protein